LSSRRILSLWFKRLSVERVVRQEKISFETPVVIILNEGNQGTVCNLNVAAELQGLFIGQSIRDTILRCPNVIVRFFDLEEDYRFLDLLSRWSGKYSPWIKKELPDGILIDITGCAHLFGGEQGLIEAFKIDCANFSLTAHIGLADTVGAAWALSRFLENTSELLYTGDIIDQEARATRARAFKRGNQPSSLTIDQKNNELSSFKYVIAPCGQTREYISNLPLASLRISLSKVTSLRRLGFRCIKDLLEIPRAPLTRRFGRDLLTRLDQILGLEPEPVSPEKSAKRFSVRLTLPEPIGLKSDFLLALEKLVPALCRKLKNNRFGVRKLQLQIFRTDGTTQSIYIQLTQPSFDTEKILTLLGMKLDKIISEFGVDLIRLETKIYEPVYETQYVKELSEDNLEIKKPSTDTDFEHFLNRISLRLGTESITRWHSAESHIPEKSFITSGAMWSEPFFNWVSKVYSRPTVLFNPEPIEIQDNFSPLKKFKWRGRYFNSTFKTGPERISPEWWFDDPNWRTGVRDYWKIDTETGERLWLYYAHGGFKTGGWFCQGCFS